jgi:hypothetical protein
MAKCHAHSLKMLEELIIKDDSPCSFKKHTRVLVRMLEKYEGLPSLRRIYLPAINFDYWKKALEELLPDVEYLQAPEPGYYEF